MKLTSAIAALVALIGASAASAASVTALESGALGVSYTVSPNRVLPANSLYADPQNGLPLFRRGNARQNGRWRTGVQAGQFWLNGDQGGQSDSFIAFCLEYDVSGVSGLTYTSAALDSGLTATQSSDIRKLWNGAYDSIASAANGPRRTYAAAFQLALWEIIEEAPGVGYNLSRWSAGGDFRVGNIGDFDGAKTIAQGWLDSLAGWTETDKQLVRLTGYGQDLLAFAEPAPVPLPAGVGLLVAGLGALGVAARRKAG